MTAAELRDDLAARGLRVSCKGGRLMVGPAALVTADDRRLIGEHKDGLLALVAERPDVPAGAAVVTMRLADSTADRPRLMWTYEGADRWYYGDPPVVKAKDRKKGRATAGDRPLLDDAE